MTSVGSATGLTATTASATEQLADLLQLIETEVPDVPAVISKLNELAALISSEGIILREEMITSGAYSVICRAWLTCSYSGAEDVPSPNPQASACRDAILRILHSVTPDHPEIIDEIGWQIISQALGKTNSVETHILVLRLLRNCFVKCEENRENFVWNLSLVEPLVDLIFKDRPSSDLVLEWCSTMKAMLLSDDVSFVYNRAPERKRVVSRTRVLPLLAGLLNEPQVQEKPGTLNSLVVVLGTMACSEDWCLHIEAGNVLPGIRYIFMTHAKNKTLVRNTISLLRYLCVNETVRGKCSTYTFIKWVVECMLFYKDDKEVVDVALSCCSMMTIKNACQVSQFLNTDGINLLYTTMNENDSDVTILKGALFTLRNIIESTNSEFHGQIRDTYTDILRSFALNVPEVREYYILPILRLLGLKETVTPEDEDEEEEEEEELELGPGGKAKSHNHIAFNEGMISTDESLVTGG